MFAITGITGQVGGQLARRLLADGHSVRAVLRDPAKAAPWRDAGCEVALAEMTDVAALTAAFAGAEGVFVLLPPTFDPSPGFPESAAVIEAVHAALAAARPRRVVVLSTIGAQAAQENLLTQLQRLERRLATLDLPMTFLRPGWFMENTAWDIAGARDLGVLDAFLQPRGRAIPMVATHDVAQAAAALLVDDVPGRRVVELEGPVRVAPADIAATLGRLLGREVRVHDVPRATWDALFRSQGMRHPGPRIAMIDGFNEGWIAFEGAPDNVRRGTTSLETVLRGLIGRAA